jgi:lysozyme
MRFPQSIQSVLISMRFQLGRTGFRNFRKMIMAFRDWNFAEAIVQMRDSKWYEQVPTRANELIKMVKGEL